MAIEGLQSSVSGVELRRLCAARAEHHAKRSAEYRKQSEMFPDDANDESQLNAGKSSSSPRRDLLNKADDHADRGKFLAFVGEHVGHEETYDLSKSDLATLGIIKSGY